MSFDIQAIKAELNACDRKALLAAKYGKVQAKLAEQGLDGLVCFKPQNTFYLSGFNPILYSHPVVVVLPAVGHPVLLCHCLRDRHSHDECVLEDIRLFGAWGKSKPVAADVYTAISMVCDDLNLKSGRLGFEGDFVSVVQYQKLADAAEAAELVNFSSQMNYLRMIKDEYDINLMRLSAYLGNIGMKAAIDNIRKSEVEASIASDIAMREAWVRDLGEFEVGAFGNTEGGIVNALWTYSMSGYRVAYGCDCPKNRVPREGEVCLPVAWSSIGSLQTEIERTVIIGKLDEEHDRAYDCMLEARRRAKAVAKAGLRIGDLYDAAGSAFIDFGFKDYLPGRIGHGLGVSLHEAPSLDRGSDMILEEGMAITIEPGIVFPGWGSVRDSDSVIVRKGGIEVLSEYPEEKIVR